MKTKAVELEPATVQLQDPEPKAKWTDYQDSGLERFIGELYLCHVLFALAESGVLARLRATEAVPESRLVAEVNRHFALHLLRYLEVEGIVEKIEAGWRLTPWGRRLTGDVAMAQLGFYIEAYGPVMSRMPGLLKGTLRYGRDVRRDGKALGRHCTTLNRTFFTPIISRILTEAGATAVLDLGCGAGTLLIDLARADPKLKAIGLDSAPDAVAYAVDQVEAAGLSDRIAIVKADAFEPQTWPERCREVDAVTAIGVMHERLREGDGAVVSLLDAYARLLGPRLVTFVLGEPELYYDARDNDSEMYLAHIFTEQGIPRRRELWLELFAASALRCRRVFDRPGAGPRLVFFDLVAR